MQIINNQPIEKVDYREDGSLDVHSIFDTIQGEGPFAGTPATFVRLAGCNLNCRFCDTEYTKNRTFLSQGDLLRRVFDLPQRELVVFTGGEPFRQDFRQVAVDLIETGRQVQIETNGTLYLDLWDDGVDYGVKVVCSPKTPKIDDRMWRQIDALKYVVQEGQIDTDGLPLSSVGPQYGRPSRPPKNWKGQIYVQPLDSQDSEANQRNLQAAVKSCMDHNYRLCVQIHKGCGLP